MNDQRVETPEDDALAKIGVAVLRLATAQAAALDHGDAATAAVLCEDMAALLHGLDRGRAASRHGRPSGGADPGPEALAAAMAQLRRTHCDAAALLSVLRHVNRTAPGRAVLPAMSGPRPAPPCLPPFG